MSAEGFNYDNIVLRMLTRVIDVMLLSVLFVLFSVPIVTIGASFTAMYYTAIKGLTGDGGYVWKYFVKSFKENFKQSTVIWLILAAAFGVLGVDIWFWMTQWTTDRVEIAKPFLVVSIVLLSIAVIIFIYVFPLQSKFENKVGVQLKNALIMGVRYFPTTLLLALIACVVVWMFYYQTILSIVGFVLIGFGIVGYLNSYFLLRCFKPYLPEERKVTDDYDYKLVFEEDDEAELAGQSDDESDVDMNDAAESEIDANDAAESEIDVNDATESDD